MIVEAQVCDDRAMVFFAAQLSNEDILAIFERAAEQLRITLQQYDQVPDQLDEQLEDYKSPREEFFWKLTLESGHRTTRARLEWIEDVIARIRNGEVPRE